MKLERDVFRVVSVESLLHRCRSEVRLREREM